MLKSISCTSINIFYLFLNLYLLFICIFRVKVLGTFILYRAAADVKHVAQRGICSSKILPQYLGKILR